MRATVLADALKCKRAPSPSLVTFSMNTTTRMRTKHTRYISNRKCTYGLYHENRIHTIKTNTILLNTNWPFLFSDVTRKNTTLEDIFLNSETYPLYMNTCFFSSFLPPRELEKIWNAENARSVCVCLSVCGRKMASTKNYNGSRMFFDAVFV